MTDEIDEISKPPDRDAINQPDRTMVLNIVGLDERTGEGRCLKRESGHNDLYLDVAIGGKLYFDVPKSGESRVLTSECGCIAPDPPYYRCSRDYRHADDHAAHGGYSGIGGDGIKMFARWKRGTGDESPRLIREQQHKEAPDGR